MASSLSYPLVNGVRHTWASVEARFSGRIFYFPEINYSRTRERPLIYLNHPDPVGKPRGKNGYAADATMLLAEFNLFQQLLAAQAQQLNVGYGDVFFDVLVSYNENGFDVITDTIKGCTLDSTEAAGAEGTDPLKRKFNLSPIKILFNGIDDLGPLALVAPPGG